ncbi:Kcna3, partial [Symbiodinium microadriaticum]
YTFELNFIQKIFVLFDKPESCILATYLTGAMMIVIMVSCLVYILSSDPGLMHKPDTCSDPACDDDPQFCPGYKICAPESARVFNVLEVTCVSIFIVDYFTRVALVPFVPSRVAGVLPSNWDIAKASVDTPDPVLPYHVQILKYAAKPMNVVDLVAILPFFIGFVSSDVGSFSITRIIRLVRVLRVFRIGSMKKFLAVLTTTFRASTTALSILLFFAMLLVILFAAIIFILEQGEFVVNEDFPDGAYVRWDALKSEKEESPFKSILVSCYWAIVTTTTVGYGDLYPTSPIGRTVSVVLMFTGILIIALPVGVIGSAFSKAFEEMEEKDKANEMRLLQEDMNTTEDEEVPSTRHEMILAME